MKIKLLKPWGFAKTGCIQPIFYKEGDELTVPEQIEGWRAELLLKRKTALEVMAAPKKDEPPKAKAEEPKRSAVKRDDKSLKAAPEDKKGH